MASQPPQPCYLAIDLKSFYAGVECVDRQLDPLATKLVVADRERGRSTICLAVSPALKRLGVRNRCRVFEIPEGIDYVAATPRMRRYLEVSASIYALYLRFASADDVFAYSIDECFINAGPYLSRAGIGPRALAQRLIDAVRAETGLVATAGIGTNLFLAKVALDVGAKHDPSGIGMLDESSFRRAIWFHRPLTDIWGIGPGIARRLAKYGAHDLASVAALRPATLYREFGKNAEYLIDHAWGQEPCTLAEVRAYRPAERSLVNGQVLPGDYTFDEARAVLREMADASILELVEKRLVAGRLSLHVGYARPADAPRPASFFDGGHGKRPTSPEARGGAPHTGGSRKLGRLTSSRRLLAGQLLELFDETTRRDLPIRRLSIGFEGLEPEANATATLFDDRESEERERHLQEALVAVRSKFGKNSLLTGVSLREKATARARNSQIGGHRA